MICQHEVDLEPVPPRAPWVRGVPEAGDALGPPPPLPDLRPRPLLRQLAGPPCHAPFPPDHPVIASFEPGERWPWCYVDKMGLPVPEHILPVLRH
jgi:hypothetical protein